MTLLLYGLVVWLFAVGIWGMVTSRNALHLIGCLSVAQASTYALLLAIGYRSGSGPPIVPPERASLEDAVDPVVQALAVTDIVVGVTSSALMIGLAVQAHKRFGTLDPAKLRPNAANED